MGDEEGALQVYQTLAERELKVLLTNHPAAVAVQFDLRPDCPTSVCGSMHYSGFERAAALAAGVGLVGPAQPGTPGPSSVAAAACELIV